MLVKFILVCAILSIYQLGFGQRGMLQSDPNWGKDTFRVYNYSDTIFENYQSYPDVKGFLKDRFRFRYTIDRCQFIGIANYFYNIDKPKEYKKIFRPGFFNVTNSSGESIALYGTFDAQFEDDSISSILISGGDHASVHIKRSKISSIVIASDTLHSFKVQDSLTRINRMLVWFSFIDPIAINYLADTLELIDFRVSTPLNFKGAIKMDNRNKTHHLRIRSNDVDKIDFEYHNFKLYFRGDETYDDKVGVYTALLESFKRKGYSSSYEKLDKEFQEFQFTQSGYFGYLANWIAKNWWDYGYTKSLVLRNALFLNVFFFVINFFFFNKLIHQGYNIRKFVIVNSSLKKKFSSSQARLLIAKIPYVFLYTSYIFWGLRLDINNLGIHKIGLFGYVLLQYVTGVVCLAYLANWIITF